MTEACCLCCTICANTRKDPLSCCLAAAFGKLNSTDFLSFHSRVILPLTDSIQSQQWCFEKALFMSGLNHVAIHATPCVPCFSKPLCFSLLQGCITNVEKWLLENCGVILGICAGVAVVEVIIFSLGSERLVLMSHSPSLWPRISVTHIYCKRWSTTPMTKRLLPGKISGSQHTLTRTKIPTSSIKI